MNLFNSLDLPDTLLWVISKYYSAPRIDEIVISVFGMNLDSSQKRRLRICKHTKRNQNKRYIECGALIFEIGKRYCPKHAKNNKQEIGILSCSGCKTPVIREDARCWNCYGVREYFISEVFPQNFPAYFRPVDRRNISHPIYGKIF